MLLSAGYEPPRQLFVHGYLNLDNQKISKSLGNVLDPLDLVDEYGVDPVRFWVARVVPFGQDGDVTLDGFRERYERSSRIDLGNLLSRTTAMIARYRDGELTQARRRVRRPRQGDAGAAGRDSGRLRPLGRDRRARVDLGPSFAASTVTSSRRSRGSSRRTRSVRPTSTGRSTSSPTASGSSRSRSPRTCPTRRRASSRRCGRRRTSPGTNVALRPHARDVRDRAGGAALPADRRARGGVG